MTTSHAYCSLTSLLPDVGGHIINSPLFGNGFSTPESRALFSDHKRLQRWLDVEVALAESQAAIGMIPHEAAATLAKTAKIERLNMADIQKDIEKTGHSLVPLLKAWQAITPEKAARYIHYGATTQDIQDTAQSLELCEALDIIERDIKRVANELSRLAKMNRDVVMVGRTHGQQALPTTLGLKCSVWLDATLRNLTRLQHIRKEVAVAQLFGGVGTMDAFGTRGEALLALFARRLQLRAPLSAWHVSRDRIVHFVMTMALVTGELANITNEILQLSKTEIGEVSEGIGPGAIGSSTMPHKHNPENSERVVALARMVKSAATLSLDCLCNEHERDYRSVRLEWVAITESVVYTAEALELTHKVLSNLQINYSNISANVKQARYNICSEALMFILSNKLGKPKAYDIMYNALQYQRKHSNSSLIKVLMSNSHVANIITEEELEATVKPHNHIGLSHRIVDRVTAQARFTLAQTASSLFQ